MTNEEVIKELELWKKNWWTIYSADQTHPYCARMHDICDAAIAALKAQQDVKPEPPPKPSLEAQERACREIASASSFFLPTVIAAADTLRDLRVKGGNHLRRMPPWGAALNAAALSLSLEAQVIFEQLGCEP